MKRTRNDPAKLKLPEPEEWEEAGARMARLVAERERDQSTEPVAASETSGQKKIYCAYVDLTADVTYAYHDNNPQIHYHILTGNRSRLVNELGRSFQRKSVYVPQEISYERNFSDISELIGHAIDESANLFKDLLSSSAKPAERKGLDPTVIDQPRDVVPKYDSIIAAVPENRRGLLVKVAEILCEGDEARITAVQRASEAPGKDAAAPTERPAPQPLRLPDEIPESQWYRNRPKGQSLRQFLEVDGWPAPYVKAKILPRPELHKRDPSAYAAIYSTKEGAQLPPDLIPTKPRLVDEELSHVDRQLIREARRLESAQERRRVGLRRT